MDKHGNKIQSNNNKNHKSSNCILLAKIIATNKNKIKNNKKNVFDIIVNNKYNLFLIIKCNKMNLYTKNARNVMKTSLKMQNLKHQHFYGYNYNNNNNNNIRDARRRKS